MIKEKNLSSDEVIKYCDITKNCILGKDIEIMILTILSEMIFNGKI